MSPNKFFILVIGICLLAGSLFFNVMLYRASSEISDINVSMKNELDSIYAEADTLADIQKIMIVAYPTLTKWEAMAYAPIIRERTKTHKTPFPLAISVMGVENLTNPTLVSAAGCRGLGQLGSTAASDGCKRLSIPYKEGYTEWVEPINLALSLTYFCTRYEDSGRVFAVKSYVGGNNYRVTEKANGKGAKYIKDYSQLVEREELKIKNILTEADKLTYIYKGILYERFAESAKMSRTQRALVRRVQKQNPTRPAIPVDSSRGKSKVPIMLNENVNTFPPIAF